MRAFLEKLCNSWSFVYTQTFVFPADFRVVFWKDFYTFTYHAISKYFSNLAYSPALAKRVVQLQRKVIKSKTCGLWLKFPHFYLRNPYVILCNKTVREWFICMQSVTCCAQLFAFKLVQDTRVNLLWRLIRKTKVIFIRITEHFCSV